MDPLKVKVGQEVEVFPTDSDFNHHVREQLVSTGTKEVVIELKPRVSDGLLRIHYPRIEVHIQPVDQ